MAWFGKLLLWAKRDKGNMQNRNKGRRNRRVAVESLLEADPPPRRLPSGHWLYIFSPFRDKLLRGIPKLLLVVILLIYIWYFPLGHCGWVAARSDTVSDLGWLTCVIIPSSFTILTTVGWPILQFVTYLLTFYVITSSSSYFPSSRIFFDLAYLPPTWRGHATQVKALTTCRESIGIEGDVRLFYFYFPIDLLIYSIWFQQRHFSWHLVLMTMQVSILAPDWPAHVPPSDRVANEPCPVRLIRICLTWAPWFDYLPIHSSPSWMVPVRPPPPALIVTCQQV